MENMALAMMLDSSEEALAAAMAGASAVSSIISLAISVLSIVAMWVLFTKAGEAGWKSIIPIYNGWTMCKIIYGQGWKIFLMLVPVLNFVFAIAYSIRTAQVYGKGIGFGILNLFFSPITLLILAFGNSSYQGPVDSFI